MKTTHRSTLTWLAAIALPALLAGAALAEGEGQRPAPPDRTTGRRPRRSRPARRRRRPTPAR